MKIAVTGATGFIGSQLIVRLLEKTDAKIIALSRSELKSNNPRVECVTCDLYSFSETQKVLADCEVGIYLVHSMAPSSKLSQGTFDNFDFLLADNFARSAEFNGLKHIVYVGGLINDNEKLSPHLQSRLEVENTLGAVEVLNTNFRCGLVMGPRGSSFRIVKNLIARLYFLVLPRWAYTETQVTSLDRLLDAVIYSILNPKETEGTFDFVNSKKITYAELLKSVTRMQKLNRFFIYFPFIPISISKLWVQLISGSPKKLVYPLVQSLHHSMIARADHIWNFQETEEDLDSMVKWSLDQTNYENPPFKKTKKFNRKQENLVQSVQRLPMPGDMSIKQVALEYMDWLPKFLFPFLKVTQNEDQLDIFLKGVRRPLLSLSFAHKQNTEIRELFYISGGVLVKKNRNASLEFRQGPTDSTLIAAIHSFNPRLYWPVYRFSQAIVHKLVMYFFGRHLSRQQKRYVANQ